jgi:hypothetical protein
MRERLLHAPAWVLGLVDGTLFALVWILLTRFGGGDSWSTAVVYGVVAGVVFGALMSRVQHRQQQGLREVAARSPEGLSRRVRRAASRGPVPEDPQIREAARGLARAQLGRYEQQRWASPFFVLVALLSALLAVTDTAWWWLAAVVWIGAAVWHPYARDRLRRRVALLAPGAAPQG